MRCWPQIEQRKKHEFGPQTCSSFILTNDTLTEKEQVDGNQEVLKAADTVQQAQGCLNTFIYNTDCSHISSFFVYLANRNSSSSFLQV